MSNSTPDEAVAAEVRAALGRKRVSAAALAAGTGISTSSMSRRLQGTHSFTVDELYRIAEFLGINAATLLGPIESAKASA